MLAFKTGSLSSIPRTHMVAGENMGVDNDLTGTV